MMAGIINFGEERLSSKDGRKTNRTRIKLLLVVSAGSSDF